MRTYWQRIPSIIGPARKENFDEVGQKATRDSIEAFILEHSDESTVLLDAGCNTGVEGYRLFHKGFKGKYVGMDSNGKAIAYAIENLLGHDAAFRISDLEKIRHDDRSFDIVLCKDVIEHQQHYRPILAELCRLVRRWLILALFIKPHDSPGDRIALHVDGYFLNCYSRPDLYRFMAEQGFPEPATIYADDQDEVLVFERM